VVDGIETLRRLLRGLRNIRVKRAKEVAAGDDRGDGGDPRLVGDEVMPVMRPS
jgi:hypothetical protein